MSIFLCGGSCIEDIQENLRPHLESNPFFKIPSSDRILNRLKSLSTELQKCYTERGKVEHQYNFNDLLCLLNLKLLKKLNVFNQKKLTLDYDNTIIFSEKSDCKMTYKRNYGYQPGVCTINSEHVVYLENRNGNSDARSFQHETLERIFSYFEKLNIRKIDNFRADSASYLYEVIKLVDKKVHFFYIGAKNISVNKQFKKIENWRQTLDEKGEEIEIGDVYYTPFIQHAKIKKEPTKIHRLVVKRKNNKTGQTNLYTQDDYEYRAIITNNFTLETEKVILFYNKRGKMERQFDILKNDFGWNKMSFSKLEQNTVFLYFMAIIKNIYSKLISHFSKIVKGLKPQNRLKKFIFKFIIMPAKWIKRSRQNILKVYGNYPPVIV